jgi:GYF domain 2
MASHFYIQIKGIENGPMNSKELMLLAQLGRLSPTDMVRMDGSDKWVLASRIKELEFGSPQEESEVEIEEVLVVDPEPIPPPSFLSSPNPPTPSGQSAGSISAPNINLPPPPDYGFVETVATMYNTMGVVTLIGSFIAVLIVSSVDSGGKDAFGQKFGSVIGIIIFGAIASITCFAMAQLFTMAINGSKNLHYIMHSNMVAMRVIVNQFSKKD